MRFFKVTLFLSSFLILLSMDLPAQTCFDTGTLLYREDFGGNKTTDPTYAPYDISGGYSDFPFSSGGSEGYYSLVKTVVYSGTYWTNTDHTYFNDVTRGYFMYVNPSAGQMNSILYQKQINGLCDGVEVLLSLWITDVCIKAAHVSPKFQLVISDAVTNAVLAQTGTITATRWTSQAAWKWERYTTSVVIPAGTSSIKFTVINKENSTSGNDLSIDDIEIFLCTNSVTTTANGSSASSITLANNIQTVFFKGSYVNDAKFGTNITSYWVYSTTGDITSFTDWTPLDQKSAAVVMNNTHSHDFTLMNAKPGYYRLVVGRQSDVLTSLCRAASQVIHIQ